MTHNISIYLQNYQFLAKKQVFTVAKYFLIFEIFLKNLTNPELNSELVNIIQNFPKNSQN
jgi:hypothetical protein